MTDQIPSNAEVDKVYAIDFNHKMPADYHGLDVRDEQVSLVALLSYKDLEVINANDANLVRDAVSITAGDTHLLPSMCKALVLGNSVSLNLPEVGAYTFKVFTLNGCELVSTNVNAQSTGVQHLDLSTGQISQGAYVMTLEKGGEKLLSKSFLVR